MNKVPKSVSLDIGPKFGSIDIRAEHADGFTYVPVSTEHEGLDTIQFGRNLPDGSTVITSIRIDVRRQLPVRASLSPAGRAAECYAAAK